APVEIERQAEDDSGDVEFGEDRGKRLSVLGKGAARQGPKGRGYAARDVGDRKADGFRAKVDADQARLGREAEGEIFDCDRTTHWRDRPITVRRASRLTVARAGAHCRLVSHRCLPAKYRRCIGARPCSKVFWELWMSVDL